MQRAKFAWSLPGAIRLTLQIDYGIINQIYIRNVKEMNWKRRTIFIILTLIMLVALGCAIFFVACDKEVSDAGEAPDGSVCPDFTVQIYDNATGELTERTYSPSDSRVCAGGGRRTAGRMYAARRQGLLSQNHYS